MPPAGGRAGVCFDERAFAEDVGRLSPAGRLVLARARDEFERDGIPLELLRACHGEHESGTSLPGCLKVYLPDTGSGGWSYSSRLGTPERYWSTSPLESGISREVRLPRTPTRSHTADFMDSRSALLDRYFSPHPSASWADLSESASSSLRSSCRRRLFSIQGR